MTNVTKGTVLAEHSRRASGPFGRGIGLMGRRSLPAGDGLIIQPCNSVVSFFMRFPIDVLFMNGEGEILYILPEMVPWRTSKIVRGAKYVVELPAGTAESAQTEVGDRIEISQV